ncbi:unnamed protein product [Miscanthus lutarioriparius]|uniref:Uncharacterized protein n=1 Tax=Miscanthus lutarioriparius TaxID=422564 RepID=A0A811RHK1_9POAL|nr:unnamed protein product [Miscanthus lutarioriparius]
MAAPPTSCRLALGLILIGALCSTVVAARFAPVDNHLLACGAAAPAVLPDGRRFVSDSDCASTRLRKALYELYFNIYVNGDLAVKDFDLSSVNGFLAYPYYIDFIVDVKDEGILKLAIGGSKKSLSDEVSGILNALEIKRMNKTSGGMDGDFSIDLDMEYVVGKGIGEFARSLLCGFIFAGLFVALVMLVLRLRTELRNNSGAWSWRPIGFVAVAPGALWSGPSVDCKRVVIEDTVIAISFVKGIPSVNCSSASKQFVITEDVNIVIVL